VCDVGTANRRARGPTTPETENEADTHLGVPERASVQQCLRDSDLLRLARYTARSAAHYAAAEANGGSWAADMRAEVAQGVQGQDRT